MSTCQGAPPPHNDCRHGKACDWQLVIRKDIAQARYMVSTNGGETWTATNPPLNRAARRAAAKANR